MRIVLATILVATLAANPCFARNSHPQRGASANSTNNAAGGKAATGTNSAPNNSGAPIDAEATVAPPVLPPHGGTKQQIRTINPSKTVSPGNLSRGPTGAVTTIAPIVRNAIGQPVAPPKNFAGAQPQISALQKPSVVSAPILHSGIATPPGVSSSAARVNLANTGNRGSINGASVIRPAVRPSGIGGPAQAGYGINGATVQSRH